MSTSSWAIILLVYFLPTIVAFYRGRREAEVAVLNTFLGWTFFGWVIALVMAVGSKPAPPAANLGPRYDIHTGERLR